MNEFERLINNLYSDYYMDLSHHGAGTNMRNNLKLWWQPSWNEPKPPIVEWFNSKNIFHADDMSGTIQEALRCRAAGEEFNLDEHLKIYFEHWKNQGFKDGIFKVN